MALEKNHALGDQSMVVDVDAYVDHFYIHYKTQTASHLARMAQRVFGAQREKAISQTRGDVTADQLNAMLAEMDAEAPASANTQKIIDSLQNGSLLEQTLNNIANRMNASIESAYGNTYSSTISNVQSAYNSALKNGGMGANMAASFFDEIDQALQLIGEGMNSAELSSFRAIQKVFAMGSGWSEDLVVVSKDSVSLASKIIKYLSNAAQKLSVQGSLSTQSFANTITQIFSNTIGGELARQMVQTALQDIENQTDEVTVEALTQVASRNNATVKLSGRDFYRNKDNSKRYGKTSVFSSNVFELSTFINGQQTTIEVGTNVSVKWQQKKAKNIYLTGSFPIQTAFEGLDANGKHIAYNMIAHRYSSNFPAGAPTSRSGNFYQAYDQLRSLVAGSFFTEWLSGSGNRLSSGRIDKAQFLMYNGRIYSMMSIINQICLQLEQGKNPIGIEFKGLNSIDNSFRGDKVSKENMSIYWANQRSAAVAAAINALTISGNLNSNILKGLL